MLTAKELNEVQRLLNYLNANLNDLRADITLTDSNGETSAVLGYDGGEGYHVLKEVPSE